MIEALTDLAYIIAALAGGAFGAAIGPLPAFVFTGFMVIAGEASAIAGGGGAITDEIAFGPAFSPAVSFAGGVAATAYAAKKGYMDGFEDDYHQAKNIAQALGTKPDVLVVGALFGVLGYWLTVASEGLGMPYDPIAMGVVLSAIFHRLILGYSIIGKVRGSGILDMSPFERGERRTSADGGSKVVDSNAATDETPEGGDAITPDKKDRGDEASAGRFTVEPWLPHQYKWGHVATLGLFVGILGAWIAIMTESAFLGFGISAASLLFLNLGIEKVPVTHHITLPAGTAAMAVYDFGGSDFYDTDLVSYQEGAVLAAQSAEVALVVGLVFGVICALFGELFQRVFYAHGDTHVDPPAAAIVFGTFLVALLYVVGVFPHTVWVPWF
ncbi:hypothetical protein [Natronorubrum daqingense]|uniref:DUF7973 domain-containing protein n=1 Tax=Natronorubrum daqingense TaxID=588898 RepID=A0A1N7C2B6_9EURY|nr:hypothetical protein [Natronorubrum daqingense]APX96708.1 hypothetical protein BB347_08815 [Natronorubrum daqingense]SIR57771.1 hypothetical protein SAMN05421809_1482 [Natronorubrum daqingense]